MNISSQTRGSAAEMVVFLEGRLKEVEGQRDMLYGICETAELRIRELVAFHEFAVENADVQSREALNYQRRITDLERDLAQWKNNHATEVRRARTLKERTDMPIERVDAYEKWGQDIEQICRLSAENAALRNELIVQSYWGPRWEAEHAENETLRQERDRWQQDATTLTKTVERLRLAADERARVDEMTKCDKLTKQVGEYAVTNQRFREQLAVLENDVLPKLTAESAALAATVEALRDIHGHDPDIERLLVEHKDNSDAILAARDARVRAEALRGCADDLCETDRRHLLRMADAIEKENGNG